MAVAATSELARPLNEVSMLAMAPFTPSVLWLSLLPVFFADVHSFVCVLWASIGFVSTAAFQFLTSQWHIGLRC
ncbi:hypothetical protein GGR57DRAFT_446997 [Xylariaceae sp. FL1272]|nr:hypothetical protein GGR57DRAFT_446997 [Xylariaceae sp. FL1272]